MSTIDAPLVEKLGTLSRLTFTDEQNKTLQSELGNILDFISQLQEVNTDGIEPMASAVATAQTPERQDKVTEENRRDAYLAVAPAEEMGFYVVPRVIE